MYNDETSLRDVLVANYASAVHYANYIKKRLQAEIGSTGHVVAHVSTVNYFR